MTDDSCGCNCKDCRVSDIHTCGSRSCLYTKYRRQRERANYGKAEWEQLETALETLKDPLRVAFRRIQQPEARARLLEWAECIKETATLEPEVRTARRAEKELELYGRADYRRNAVTRGEVG